MQRDRREEPLRKTIEQRQASGVGHRESRKSSPRHLRRPLEAHNKSKSKSTRENQSPDSDLSSESSLSSLDRTTKKPKRAEKSRQRSKSVKKLKEHNHVHKASQPSIS